MRLLRSGLVCALALTPASAAAWTEAEPTDADLLVSVDADGRMVGVYRVAIAIDAGRFHGFDLDGLPQDFAIDPAGSRAEDAHGQILGVTTESWRSGRMHVGIDTPRGERRGRVTFTLAFTARASVVEEDGRAVVTVSTPPWDHGMHRTIVAIEVPSAPGDVEVVDADLYDDLRVEDLGDGTRVTAMRHRLPRWTPMSVAVRLPQGRVGGAIGPEPGAVVRTARPPRPPRVRPRTPAWQPWVLGLLPLLLALAKLVETRRAATRAGCLAAPAVLARLGVPLRVLLAIVLSAAGAALFASGRVALCVTCLLCGGALLALRFARATEAAPGPGRWLRVEPSDLALLAGAGRRARRRSLRLLDPTTWPGAAVTAVLFGAGAVVVHAALPSGLAVAFGIGAAFAAALVVPLGTAGGRTIPEPRTGRESRRLIRMLPAIEAVLAAEGGGGVGPIARIPEGADLPDMIRLRIGPAAAPAGLRCLEIGLEHFGEQSSPAALVRTAPGSPAERALAGERRGARFLRSPEGAESVVILRPPAPTERALLLAVRRVLGSLRTAAAAVESADAAGPVDHAARS